MLDFEHIKPVKRQVVKMKVVRVITQPGNYRGQIRKLFENTGAPGYFMIATEILAHPAYELSAPDMDFSLFITDTKVPRSDIKERKFQHPSLQQVLWAVGFASMELMNVVCEKPIRFLHPPFHVPHCGLKHSTMWRQVCISRSKKAGVGYYVGTVGVSEPSPSMSLAYCFPHEG
jgi:hypothetical protein